MENGISRRDAFKIGATAIAAAAVPAVGAVTAAENATAAIAKSSPHIWTWRVSFDGGEIYHEEFATREEAIAYAKGSGGGLVAECLTQDYHLTVDTDDVVDMLRNFNEELEGDREMFDMASKEAMADLGPMVTAAIRAWVEKHNVDMTAWLFASTRNQTEV